MQEEITKQINLYTNKYQESLRHRLDTITDYKQDF